MRQANLFQRICWYLDQDLITTFNAIKRYFIKGKVMKNRIDALSGIGKNARKITTEIGGNYVIAVSTEAARSKKRLCVYESAKCLDFTPGAVHERTLVKAFPYTSEDSLVQAHKDALKFIAKREGKISTEIGDEITVTHAGRTVKAQVTQLV